MIGEDPLSNIYSEMGKRAGKCKKRYVNRPRYRWELLVNYPFLYMVIYPSFWRIIHNSRYPQLLQHFYIHIHQLISFISENHRLIQFEITMSRLYIYINSCILSYLYPKTLSVSFCRCYCFIFGY